LTKREEGRRERRKPSQLFFELALELSESSSPVGGTSQPIPAKSKIDFLLRKNEARDYRYSRENEGYGRMQMDMFEAMAHYSFLSQRLKL